MKLSSTRRNIDINIVCYGELPDSELLEESVDYQTKHYYCVLRDKTNSWCL